MTAQARMTVSSGAFAGWIALGADYARPGRTSARLPCLSKHGKLRITKGPTWAQSICRAIANGRGQKKQFRPGQGEAEFGPARLASNLRDSDQASRTIQAAQPLVGFRLSRPAGGVQPSSHADAASTSKSDGEPHQRVTQHQLAGSMEPWQSVPV